MPALLKRSHVYQGMKKACVQVISKGEKVRVQTLLKSAFETFFLVLALHDVIEMRFTGHLRHTAQKPHAKFKFQYKINKYYLNH